MTLAELTAAERHRRIAGDLTDLVLRVSDWDAPAPVPGWVVRDVVDHLVTWLPGFLAGGGVPLPEEPGTDGDPVAAWTSHAAAVQALLDTPEQATAAFEHPHVGSMRAGEAVDRFYTSDVFMHTWDLARASGQHVALEPAFCAALLEGMAPMEAAIRASGQYGPAVAVPADADPQSRLLGFIGRDPSWRPPTQAT
jgi:uncharacterized protein (TIGR03086 family)